MPKHLILPKDAFDDFRALLSLKREQLEALVAIFASAESVRVGRTALTDQVARELKLDSDAARDVVITCSFLLSVVEDGAPPDEVLRDVESFLEEHATSGDKAVSVTVKSNISLFLSLITPSVERDREQKVQYLEELRPNVESFRTVCELRPIFESRGSVEEITGMIPVVSLVVEVQEGGHAADRLILHLSPSMLRQLRDVVERADKKMTALQAKFGKELLIERQEAE